MLIRFFDSALFMLSRGTNQAFPVTRSTLRIRL
jgi:hypothetical protein